MSEFSELTGKDTRQSNLHSGDADYAEYMSPDLSSILDPIKVNEGYSSNNLRDFYRKLLKTDIQIKNLKKGFANTKRGNIDFTDPNARLKRSLKIFAGPKRHTETLSNKGNVNKYYGLSDDLKIAKDILKNKEDSAVGSNDLEKEKVSYKELDTLL
ncbi:uncharacterized protein LOC133531899 [Cydia pomonella]|uniref:uncharacterized protein LOC133531899 n=1 Tax=Cydia pomonella TaxID=82600 RepID=UPI002ADDFEBB|nr:uncharacterized protein LOC133531899 [Cydia pomonella]XP_061726295.1 uncharacterized protein LOC133531899 [Cydia pomonella]XP_061726296.1 uncharacterized protein LOC133531899 [Cydia pomonella]